MVDAVGKYISPMDPIGLGESCYGEVVGVDDSSNLATPTIHRAEINPSKCLAALALA